MELHEEASSIQALLRPDADAAHTPMSGTIELLPLCNMDCRMCYVRQTKEEMNAQGRMLTCDEWLHIVDEACEMGLLTLLLTGGEPLLYPAFKSLYTGISKWGVVLGVNTNGTLIDENWADFFYEQGVQMLNITLYGKDDDTYEKLCRNPKGFTQVMKAAGLLKERAVPFQFNCSLTLDNIDQLSDFYRIADHFEVPLNMGTYMFPGIRRGMTAKDQYRLTAPQAAAAEMYGPKSISKEEAVQELNKLEKRPRLQGLDGFPCHAGRSDFSINWRGELLPCISFQEPKISLLEHSFETGWNYMVNACKKMPKCKACVACDLQNICNVCPAHCYSETGRPDGRPDYICQMTEYKIQELRKLAAELSKSEI